MKVSVCRAEYERGQAVGVIFGRVSGVQVYVLEDPLWAIDIRDQLSKAGGPIDVTVQGHRVARLPR